MKEKKKTTRKERREHLKQMQLACELYKVIQHFFPRLMKELKELPDPRNQSYIYLKKLDPAELQDIIHALVKRLIRSKAFDEGKIRGKYWQVIIDGTQLHSSRKELDGGVYRVHHRGKAEEYTEYDWYVLVVIYSWYNSTFFSNWMKIMGSAHSRPKAAVKLHENPGRLMRPGFCYACGLSESL